MKNIKYEKSITGNLLENSKNTFATNVNQNGLLKDLRLMKSNVISIEIDDSGRLINTIWHPDTDSSYKDRIPMLCPHCDKSFKFVHQCIIKENDK